MGLSVIGYSLFASTWYKVQGVRCREDGLAEQYLLPCTLYPIPNANDPNDLNDLNDFNDLNDLTDYDDATTL